MASKVLCGLYDTVSQSLPHHKGIDDCKGEQRIVEGLENGMKTVGNI